jgi:Zn-dependent M28 family amino/carboxypeptidase
VGAHYDTVPESPGADDNGSAVAAMLGCAAACALFRPTLPVIFVAFNREEEHLTGSQDFVSSWLAQSSVRIHCAHVLEMVGFASDDPGSQKVPTGLPIKLPERANFLGLLANGDSSAIMDFSMKQARTYLPEFPVIGLQVALGMEKFFPVLARSDHVPFWKAGMPALMWTDTSEFRNPNYHTHRDLPDTLNYRFLTYVTRVLTATVIAQARMSAHHV